jgi:hypothetical protein
MPPNDYHTQHLMWIGTLTVVLNNGGLPKNYYAMPEHVAPPLAPDVMTLGRDADSDDEERDDEDDDGGLTPWPDSDSGSDSEGGGTAVATRPGVQAEATIRVKVRRRAKPPDRHIAVRHVEGRRLVAVIELVSPSNKAKTKEVITFTGKAAALIEAGVHVTIIDPFPNPKSLPQGFGGCVLREVGRKAVGLRAEV